jgi:hypothetical protein
MVYIGCKRKAAPEGRTGQYIYNCKGTPSTAIRELFNGNGEPLYEGLSQWVLSYKSASSPSPSYKDEAQFQDSVMAYLLSQYNWTYAPTDALFGTTQYHTKVDARS